MSQLLTVNEILDYELDENAKLLYLKEHWNISEDRNIEVFGYLTEENKGYLRLKQVSLLNGDSIEYPIINLINLDSRNNIKAYGFYCPNKNLDNLDIQINSWYQAELKLAFSREREKYSNPLLLEVIPKSLKELNKIPINRLKPFQIDDEILVEKTVLDFYVSTKTKDIQLKADEVKADLKKLETNLEDKKISFEKIETDFKSLKIENRELRKKGKELKVKLDELEKFTKTRADNLRDMNFIDNSMYNNILGNKKDKRKIQNSISFQDLDNDFSKAVSHIQSYLYAKDIFYEKKILEDYFALIKTNDLIILAGDSGSGKTNLVKSFAQAVGGVSKIIPVKPNWTSSEDLLGYYNPLEKKYLSTPFLEALLEAKQNPDIPYFICLDEMNLARVEYYFADFLSILEERDFQPQIELYSNSETSHILSEFENVLEIIKSSKEKFKKNNLISFMDILKDEEINNELKKVFGFSDKDSLIKYHTDLRKMLNGILEIPSSIEFPKNVRIIGAINIDETTNYLSPKILDRAHIIKFENPLLADTEQIEKDVSKIKNSDKIITFPMESFGVREKYPKIEKDKYLEKTIIELAREYFVKLGIEVGFRTIRQGLNYSKMCADFNQSKEMALESFLNHKILPKMMFDGGSKINNDETKKDILQLFYHWLNNNQFTSVSSELKIILDNSTRNDNIINYWTK